MTNILKLYLDNTYEEITRTAKGNKYQIDKNQIATFKEGSSIFRERKSNKFSIKNIYHRRKSIGIYLDESLKLIELANDKTEKKSFQTISDLKTYVNSIPDNAESSLYDLSMSSPAFHSLFSTIDELKKYIAGEMAKTKNKVKPMETWQFFAIIIGLAVVILMQCKLLGFFGS